MGKGVGGRVAQSVERASSSQENVALILEPGARSLLLGSVSV